MIRKSEILVLACMLVGIAILASLGTWQVRRLAWKEDLIATVESRIASAPVPVEEALGAAGKKGGADGALDYRPVVVTGKFVETAPAFEFTTFKGQSGWNLFNILELGNAAGSGPRYAVVNRGFIPYEQRENWKSIAPLPTGTQEIEGLLRQPPAGKPGSMMPDNEPQSGTFYWRDIAAMAALSGINPQQLEGWYVDAGFPGKSPDGEYPVKGTTIVSFPNNHLQYAVTWYGLALALFGVGSYFLYSRRKRG